MTSQVGRIGSRLLARRVHYSARTSSAPSQTSYTGLCDAQVQQAPCGLAVWARGGRPQCRNFTGLRSLRLIKVSFIYHLPLLGGKFTTSQNVTNKGSLAGPRWVRGVPEGSETVRKEWFWVLAGIATHDLGRLTVVASQVIRFPEICSVWRQSDQVDQLTSAVKAGCFKEKSNAVREKKSKTHLPLLHTTLPYHSEIINKKFIYRSATSKA